MRQAQGYARPLSAVVLAFGITLADWCRAEEAAATEFIVSTTDRQCDEFNRSWVVANKHTYLSIKVKVRWAAVGAKEMEEEFILSPAGGRAIGCAAKLEVVSAEIMRF